MRILLLDGHPDEGRLSSHLLNCYREALPSAHTLENVAVRDLSFSPNLRFGYRQRIEWESDLLSLAGKLDECDHLVVAFPMWWGSEPAALNGLLDRLLLPGFAFAYHVKDPWWDRLLAGRSADVIITMDTPPLYLRYAWGNPIVRRWDKQVLGFCGFKPLRFLTCGPVKQGGVEKRLAKWERQMATHARSIQQRSPEKKVLRLRSFLDRSES